MKLEFCSKCDSNNKQVFKMFSPNRLIDYSSNHFRSTVYYNVLQVGNSKTHLIFNIKGSCNYDFNKDLIYKCLEFTAQHFLLPNCRATIFSLRYKRTFTKHWFKRSTADKSQNSLYIQQNGSCPNYIQINIKPF